MSEKQPPSLRFDHREIAVIFSLFIFVSLLMFTVGILVGKGLSQAKYDAAVGKVAKKVQKHHDEHGDGETVATSSHDENEHKVTSVTTPTPHEEHRETASTETKPAHKDAKAEESKPEAKGENKKVAKEETDKKADSEPFQPIPKKNQKTADLRNPPSSTDVDTILTDPKYKGMLEESGEKEKEASRGVAATTSPSAPAAYPPSFSAGKYSVQVGSYPSEKDATERVSALKKLGFQHAYFSAKELGDQKDTWYRVWLGYYPDFESAKKSGELLQSRGEVKNYLVRKIENNAG